MAFARLDDGDSLPHLDLLRLGEYLCRQLRFRQCQHIRFRRAVGETVDVDRILYPAGLYDLDGRFQGVRDVCLSLLRDYYPFAGGHDIFGARHKGGRARGWCWVR